MDNSNWRPTQAEPNMDATDWRTTLQPDSRQRIVNKIMETLKRHLPISGPEGLVELSKIATRFEEKIYTAGTSQSDYLRKISMKMLTMETKSETSMANNIQPNSAGSAQNPPDPAAHSMQSLVRNQGQSQIPLPSQSQAREQLLSQNVQNTITNTGVQSSASLPSNSDVISQNPAVEEKMPAYEKQLIGILISNRHRQPTHHTELLSAQTIKSISNTTMFKPEYLEQQKQQLEQQFQEWQMYQQWINQQMQHVLQQQEQILQEQQQ